MSKKGNSSKIFGGKVMVFGGDFRQILPVVPRGSRSDIIHASLNLSYIWDHSQVLTLTKNMRLRQGSSDSNSKEIADFSKWILKVGEGKLCEPNDGYAEIEIPKEHLLNSEGDPIKTIVDSTYPNLLDNFQNPDFLQSKAILASTIDVVDEINDYVLKMIPGEEREYLSADNIDRSEVNDAQIYDVLTPE
ncbi:helicase-like protein, partial [Trifolium medium]|nr:helicase-like protein [Trifolium medium]